MDPKKLKKSILRFSLNRGNRFTQHQQYFGGRSRGNQGYSRVLLQIIGYTGHGKSSFINSCKYVLDDGEEFREYAVTGENYAGAMTLERHAYDLTKDITIVDNRGSSSTNSFQRAEIYAQLGNFLPIGEKVEWMKDYTDLMTRLEDAEWNPNYSDFIVPILIYSAKAVLSGSERQELQEFLENCVKMTGVFPIIVITHKSSGDFMKAEKMFKQMGAEVVISIENYTEEDHIKTQGRTKDILMVIHSALEDVKYRLEAKERNPQKDWRERKKFLLEYIHEVEMEKKKNDPRGEKERKKETISLSDQMTPKLVHRGCIHEADCDREMEDEDVLSLTGFMPQRSVHCRYCMYEEYLEKKERERREVESKRNENGGGWWPFSWLFGR